VHTKTLRRIYENSPDYLFCNCFFYSLVYVALGLCLGSLAFLNLALKFDKWPGVKTGLFYSPGIKNITATLSNPADSQYKAEPHLPKYAHPIAAMKF